MPLIDFNYVILGIVLVVAAVTIICVILSVKVHKHENKGRDFHKRKTGVQESCDFHDNIADITEHTEKLPLTERVNTGNASASVSCSEVLVEQDITFIHTDERIE